MPSCRGQGELRGLSLLLVEMKRNLIRANPAQSNAAYVAMWQRKSAHRRILILQTHSFALICTQAAGVGCFHMAVQTFSRRQLFEQERPQMAQISESRQDMTTAALL